MYAGEVNDRATYVRVILYSVKCSVYRGASISGQGRGENDSAKLYIFDDVLYAEDESRTEVTYIPYEEWLALSSKDGYWTLNPCGDDFFVEGECTDKYPKNCKKFRVAGFKRLEAGSRRMWHFEVDGE